VDLWPLLAGEQREMEHPVFLYFDSWNLQCARLGRWKLHLTRYNSPAWAPAPAGGRLNLGLPAPELYDLIDDPEESYDVAPSNPEVVADLRARVEAMLPEFPSIVGDVYRAAIATPVVSTPSGALPVKNGD